MLRRAWFRTSWIITGLLGGILAGMPAVRAQTVIPTRVTLADTAIVDQDDMCVWIHPTNRSLSTVIASDKTAGKVFVYDLTGNTLQTLSVGGQPGNIDIRYEFPLGGSLVDIVAYNDRNRRTIEVYRVNPATRQLVKVDNGAITTAANYGLCLYRSPVSGALYAFTTAENGTIGQYELRDQGGLVAGTQVRAWDIGTITEACVGDDESGYVYFAEENVGIWKIGAEPGSPVTGSLVAAVGDSSGLTADVEGLTIYYSSKGKGYLMASSQGSSAFKIYQRQSPHGYVKTFKITGVTATDGIDVCNLGLGPFLRYGAFLAHNNAPLKKPVQVCGYEDIGLPADTSYWNPRRGQRSLVGVDAPKASQLTLLRVGPNPAGRLVVSFSLPDERPSTLEVLDVAGRRLAVRRVDSLGRGLHVIDLGGEAGWRAGVYVIRLTHGTTSLTRRAVIMR